MNFGNKFLHMPNHYVKEYERLLMGGIWAQVDMRFEYDEEGKGKNPFWIERLTPIQIATFDLDEYRRLRREFTTDEWIDLVLRSMGYEPAEMTRRLKLLFLLRLVPLCEHNFNLVELGPRGTGKSYVVQEISPYAALLTGSPTVATLFGYVTGKQKGLVQLWDVVAFDEVAELKNMPKELIPMLQTYCESGQFQRGSEATSGEASLALFGNTNRPVDVLVQSSHLFEPLPENVRTMAFLDRLHAYVPGWEIPKMRPELFSSHYGFVVDYLAEALRELRKLNFTEIVERDFAFGSHLVQRDRKAVQKTFSGLMKLIHPHGEVTREEMAELVELSLEMRRRVKEQLKKLGSFEYHQTSFSYIDRETGHERFVGVPEQGGRNLIPTDPPGPGTVYTAGVSDQSIVGLYRVEVSVASGTGKLKTAGGLSGEMKESAQRAFAYLNSKKTELGVGRDVDTSDFHVQVIDLIGNRVEAEIGVAVFVAFCSALRQTLGSPGPPRPRRHERPGEHQGCPFARRAAAGGDGQRCPAGAGSDREQAELPRGRGGCGGARRPGVLWGSEDGGDEGAGDGVVREGEGKALGLGPAPLKSSERVRQREALRRHGRGSGEKWHALNFARTITFSLDR